MPTRLMVAYSGKPTLRTETDEKDTITQLGTVVDGFKFGLATLAARYPCRTSSVADVFRVHIHFGSKKPILMDWKLNDIPATVEQSAREIARERGVSMITVHASTGIKALEAAMRAVEGTRVDIVAVTVLTSIDDTACYHIFGEGRASSKVLQFARDAKSTGVPAITCSPQELLLLRDAGLVGDGGMYTIVPGVRPEWYRGEQDDQARTMTPAEAAQAGADWIVVGRPIASYLVEQGGPAQAVRLIQEELRSA